MSLLWWLDRERAVDAYEQSIFAKLVPFLILFATLLFLAQGVFRRFAGSHLDAPETAIPLIWGAIFFQFAVAFMADISVPALAY